MFALYSPISVRSWKVRGALEEAGAPYRFGSIDILRETARRSSRAAYTRGIRAPEAP